MKEDFHLTDKVILPDTTVKLTINDPLLALWIKHGGSQDAGFPKVFVDNSPTNVRYRLKHSDLQDVITLLKESAVMDGWMHDCWDQSKLPPSPVSVIQKVNTSIQYITYLRAAYGGYDVFLIRITQMFY